MESMVMDNYNPMEDQLQELSNVNQELYEENLVYKDKEMVLSNDGEIILQEMLRLRRQVRIIEAELKIVKNSRDQFQNKNAELIKEVNHWRNKCKKLEK
jgi:predicted transcriptional regulator